MFKIEKEGICGWFLHAVVGSTPTPGLYDKPSVCWAALAICVFWKVLLLMHLTVTLVATTQSFHHST